jgi:hypothetical protein
MSKCPPQEKLLLISLPNECQTNILTFLRAFELTAVQQTCRYYNDPQKIHGVVSYFVDHVYGHDLAKGSTILESKMSSLAAAAAVRSEPSSSRHKTKGGDKGKHNLVVEDRSCVTQCAPADASMALPTPLYTLQDLRAIELNVVARVLSLPEPKCGFYVSKAWIKKTLLWLETVNESSTTPSSSSSATSNKSKGGKLSKKQQRQRNRRLSDVSPPWPNVNSDILCEHQNLQHCGAKAGRSRRKLMDKHAWKVRSAMSENVVNQDAEALLWI